MGTAGQTAPSRADPTDGQRAEDASMRRLGTRGDHELETDPPTRDADRRARDPATPFGRSAVPSAAWTGRTTTTVTTQATRGRRASDSDHDASDGRRALLGWPRQQTRTTRARPAIGPRTGRVAALDRRGKMRHGKVHRGQRGVHRVLTSV